MKRMKLLVCGLVFLFTGVLCFGILSETLAEYKDYPVPKECMDQVRKEGSKLNLYDWAEWWPEKLFKDFEEEFGVKITRDNFASGNEMITKLKLNPKAPYDMINGTGPTDFLRLKNLGLLQKINHDWIPNVNAYLIDSIKNLSFDPGYQYSVSDSIYFTNYVFNKKYVDPNDPNIDSWKILFEGEKYAGKMTMINSPIDLAGSALKYLGYSWFSDNEEELMKAKEVLLRQKPRVIAYDSWPKRLLLEEEAWISNMWSGDSWFLSQEDKNLMGALPREGCDMGTDLSVIPIGSTHPATAHLWLNYLFRTEVYALLINTIAYTPVHKAALPLLDKEMLKWPGAQPSEEYIKKCEFTDPKALTGKGFELRTKIWEDLKK